MPYKREHLWLDKPLMMKRLCRKRNRDIVFTLLLIFVLIVIWLNLYFTRTLGEKWNFVDCFLPCYDVTCAACKPSGQQRTASIDIVELLKLKHEQRSFATERNKSQSQVLFYNKQQVCKKPSFDLSHDSVKYAFFSLKALNCTGTKLFYKDYPVFRLNKTVLRGRKIKKCLYFGINRLNDDFQMYTEPYVKEKGPFDLIFKQDFIHVKCYLKDRDKDSSTKLEKAIQLEHLDVNKETNFTRIKNNTSVTNRMSLSKTVGANKNVAGHHIDKSNNNNNSAVPDLHLKKIGLKNATKTIYSNKFKNRTRHNNEGSKNLRKGQNRLKSATNTTHLNKLSKFPKVKRNLDQSKIREEKRNLDPVFSHGTKVDRTKKKSYTSSITRKLLEERGHADKYTDGEDPDGKEEIDAQFYDPFEGYQMEETADFEQLMAQIYPKSSVFDRISQRLHRRRNQPYMNVLMIGLDSMSHLSFQRKLPLTYKYLQQTLKAVILDGYNIVGDATTAAMIPMLTGKFETELPEVRRNQFESKDMDIYPLIWKNFQELGYATMFAEDEPSIGMFNLRLNGFKDQPTDHYMRPFWQALWESESRRSSPRYCTGSKPNHEYLLDYLKDFYHQYSNVSKFALLFGSELTHWDNNPGEYMDQDLTDLLVYLEENKYLENTLLIVMGDHGARYSRVRKTIQGKMEERLPMMSLRFPKWFKKEYPKLIRNLYKNKNKLATPFDIHETLLDVLDLRRTELPVNQSRRSFSLLQSIPLNRTCASSDIQMHWCTCLKQVNLEPSDKHVIKSAQSMLNFINNRTAAVRDQCSLLAVKQILNAQLLIPNEKVLMFQKSQDDDQRVANFSQNINIDHAHFQVTIETGPNKGLYEATIQVNMTAGSYTVIDDISRLNLYGNQPTCIQDKYPDLRKYCFCTKSSIDGKGSSAA